MTRLFALLLIAGSLCAQPKRVLFLTHSAGFRHGSVTTAAQVLQQLASRSGQYTVTHTEDLVYLQPDRLREFDAVFFFTSGELPIDAQQKSALLSFVSDGKGFGGAHSATDTLYGWPQYGELIGGYFDGHPWTQRVRVDVEDPTSPLTSHLAPSFELLEEIYQFRAISRANLRVLQTLDIGSVNMNAEGVNRRDEDFALTWIKPYGRGRVFYTAFGHFDEMWLDTRFQRTLHEALLWLTGIKDVDASPRAVSTPAILERGIGNAASMSPADTIAPGSIVSIYGSNLTEGAASAGSSTRLAGTVVRVNGERVPLIYAGPSQVNAIVPATLGSAATISITNASGRKSERTVPVADATPGLFAVSSGSGVATLWMTGLGKTQLRDGLQHTTALPVVRSNGESRRVLYSGLAPDWPGLYQVNVELPAGVSDLWFSIHGAEMTAR